MSDVKLDESEKIFVLKSGYVVYRVLSDQDCEISYMNVHNKSKGEGKILLREFLENMMMKGYIFFSLTIRDNCRSSSSLDSLVLFYKESGFDEVDSSILEDDLFAERREITMEKSHICSFV